MLTKIKFVWLQKGGSLTMMVHSLCGYVIKSYNICWKIKIDKYKKYQNLILSWIFNII